jgi:membrane-bound lytic murein transglycosylase B
MHARTPILALFAWLAFAVAPFPAPAAEQEAQPFVEWLRGLRVEARAKGISDAFLDKALTGLRPIPRVIELDRKQPEFTLTFWAYLDRNVNDVRIQKGRAMLAKHADILEKTAKRYGVPPHYIVAFWGMETNYGEFFGSFPLVGALATLAHDPRRSRFFREQLLAALVIMAKGDVPVTTTGSWAGAMGNFQFIPTTYRDFAVDADGDGRRDMWQSYPDMFASAANYLARSGWRRNWNWGREVSLPEGFNIEQAGLGVRKPIAEWKQLGIQRVGSGALPDEQADASVVLPAGYDGPAFLVYQNYRTILNWNRSLLYAVAVGHLADRLVGSGPLKSRRPNGEVPLSRADVQDMQRLLAAKGFYDGGADGVIGPQTRRAIRAFQKHMHLPPDGYPTAGLLERLRGTSGG